MPICVLIKNCRGVRSGIKRLAAELQGEDQHMLDEKRIGILLKKVSRLKQRDEYWEGTSRLGRMWIADDDGEALDAFHGVDGLGFVC